MLGHPKADPAQRSPREPAISRRVRAAATIAMLIHATACAHGSSTMVTRRTGDAEYVGPSYSAHAWQAALELELADSLADAGSGAETGARGRPPTTAEVAAYLTHEDPHVLAITMRRTGDCDLRVAFAESTYGTRSVSVLTELGADCPAALATAIRVALAAGAIEEALAIAHTASALDLASVPELRDASLDALLLGGDQARIDTLIRHHLGEPGFTYALLRRARASEDANVRATLLAPFAQHTAFVTEAITALVEANRMDEAKAALAMMTLALALTGSYPLTLSSLGSTPALRATPKSAPSVGSPTNAPSRICASTRALALEADAFDALGRGADAARVRSTLVVGLAGHHDE